MFGWNTTWSARNPVSAATAARTRASCSHDEVEDAESRARRAARRAPRTSLRTVRADRADAREVEVSGFLVERVEVVVDRSVARVTAPNRPVSRVA